MRCCDLILVDPRRCQVGRRREPELMPVASNLRVSISATRQPPTPLRTCEATRYLAPITSQSFAVSTYCWNLVTLLSLTSQTWQTCVSMLLPVALYVPL
jgi:hypothetical protein